jgi:hypothetical protein
LHIFWDCYAKKAGTDGAVPALIFLFQRIQQTIRVDYLDKELGEGLTLIGLTLGLVGDNT